jgi:hypothetical protein
MTLTWKYILLLLSTRSGGGWITIRSPATAIGRGLELLDAITDPRTRFNRWWKQKLTKLTFFVKKKNQSLSNQMGEQQWYQPKLNSSATHTTIHLFYWIDLLWNKIKSCPLLTHNIRRNSRHPPNTQNKRCSNNLSFIRIYKHHS